MFIVLALPLEEYKKKNHQGPEQFHWAPGSNLKFDLSCEEWVSLV